jgi:hypothetical protein
MIAADSTVYFYAYLTERCCDFQLAYMYIDYVFQLDEDMYTYVHVMARKPHMWVARLNQQISALSA